MKKYLFFIFLSCCVSIVAQKKNPVQQEDTLMSSKASVDPILDELKAIHKLQEQAKAERDTIRDNFFKNRKAAPQELTDADMSNEYGAMLKIEKNTRPDWWNDDWNATSLVAAVIALFSFFVGAFTLWAQKQTEKHTSNAPINVQLWKLRDLPRHFYRNLACTCALIFKYRMEGEELKRKSYPSESNLSKLQILPDDVVIPVDISETKDPKENPYKYMHELKLLLRNYNIEVEVASEHLSRKGITDDSLVQDFDNLLFKPIYLTKNTFDFEKSLIIQKNKKHFLKQICKWLRIKISEEPIFLAKRTIVLFLAEHFRKLKDPNNFRVLFEKESAKVYLSKILIDGQAEIKRIIEKKEGSEKGSLDRSVDGLTKYGKDEGCQVSKMKSQEIIKEVINELTPPKKNDAKIKKIFRFNLCGSKTGKEKVEEKVNQSFIPGILSIKDSKSFGDFCNEVVFKDFEDKPSFNYEETYRLLAPYLDYLHTDTGEWDIYKLLKFILAVDAAIETDRIGMVNFS